MNTSVEKKAVHLAWNSEWAKNSPIKRVWFIHEIVLPDDDDYAPMALHPEPTEKEFRVTAKFLKKLLPKSSKPLLAARHLSSSLAVLGELFQKAPLLAGGDIEGNIEFFNSGKLLGHDFDTVIVPTNSFGIHNLIEAYRWYATGEHYPSWRKGPPIDEDGPWSRFDSLSVMEICTGTFYASLAHLPENKVLKAA